MRCMLAGASVFVCLHSAARIRGDSSCMYSGGIFLVPFLRVSRYAFRRSAASWFRNVS